MKKLYGTLLMAQNSKTLLLLILGALIGTVLFLSSVYDKSYILIFYSIVTVGFLSFVGWRSKKASKQGFINIFISSNIVAWILTIGYWNL